MAVDPDAARADAREILGDRRFRSDPAPRPFRGVLRWIGDRLEPIGDALAKIPWFVWLALAIALIAGVLAWLLPNVQRRRAAAGTGGGARTRAKAEDPGALEREAADAERAGDFERAVRLRFRAGLLRLGAKGAIEYRPSVTVGEVRHVLGSADFERLASTFEEVTYGDRDAVRPDVDESRRDWPRVLQESGKR